MTEAEELELLELESKSALAKSAVAPTSDVLADDGKAQMRALGHGAVQGATLGFGDELQGGIQALGTKYLPESLGGGDETQSSRSLGDLYKENRDSARRDDASAEKGDPTAYRVGNVGAGLLTAAAPMGLPGKVGKLFKASNLGKLLATGTGLGGLSGLGKVTCSVLPETQRSVQEQV